LQGGWDATATASFNQTAIFTERLWLGCNEIVTFGVEVAGIVDDERVKYSDTIISLDRIVAD
jgi:hypothetical protein